jgi:hypothetical protein
MTRRQRLAYTRWMKRSFRPARERVSDIDHDGSGARTLTTAPRDQHRAHAARDKAARRGVRMLWIAQHEEAS